VLANISSRHFTIEGRTCGDRDMFELDLRHRPVFPSGEAALMKEI